MLIAGTMKVRTELPDAASRANLDAWLHLWGAMGVKEVDVAMSTSTGITCTNDGLHSFPLCSAFSVVAAVYLDIETIFVVRLTVHDR